MPKDITGLIAGSILRHDEAATLRYLASAFTPRECRFIVFYEANSLQKEKDPYATFPEHIPYTRRDHVLSYYRFFLRFMDKKHHERLKQAILTHSKRYTQPPLLKSDMVVSWGCTTREADVKRP
jgi:hypothetical protein